MTIECGRRKIVVFYYAQKTPSMKPLIDVYQNLLNLKNAVFLRIDHEDAMVAIVYKIILENSEPLILKICTRPNDYLREVYFLKLFAGQIPVPQLVQVVPPTNHVYGAILMEYLPGSLLNSTEITKELAYELGSQLARIHLNRLPGYGDPIQDELNQESRIYFSLKFEEGMDECKNHLPRNLMEQCYRYYETHLDLLTSVDGPCVVHRDFRPGNLMVHDGKLQGIIDWAGARASFAEEDFCSLEHGEWLNYHHKTFLAGYATIRPIPNYKKLIPFLRLNKAIATIGFTVKQNTWDNTHARVYQLNRRYLDTFF